MNERSTWPTDKLTALRLGRRLIAEVTASRPGRRAFVDITPNRVTFDDQAAQEGWVRSHAARIFRLEHWEYDADHIDDFDYDIGAMQVRAASAEDESALEGVLALWGLRPDCFDYPWATDDRGHSHPQGLVPPAEAALQHHPHHQHGGSDPRPSPHVGVSAAGLTSRSTA